MRSLTDRFRTRWGRSYTLQERAKAYKLTFRNPHGEIALADLMTFCGLADEAPMSGDPFIQGRAAGRRDVALRIREHLHLTHDELYAVIQGRSFLTAKDFENVSR